MSSEKDLHTMEAEIRELEALFSREVDNAKKSSRISLMVSSALALAVLLSIVVNFLNFRSEFSQENLSESLESELRELQPAALRELRLLARDVLPAYARAGREQLQEMGPELHSKLEAEVDQLSQDILTVVHKRLLESQRRTLEQVEKQAQLHFPELRDPIEQNRLTQNIRALCEDAIVKSIGQCSDRLGAKVKDVQDVLLRFDISDDESEIELQKRFLHLWLQLLDEEVMAL